MSSFPYLRKRIDLSLKKKYKQDNIAIVNLSVVMPLFMGFFQFLMCHFLIMSNMCIARFFDLFFHLAYFFDYGFQKNKALMHFSPAFWLSVLCFMY